MSTVDNGGSANQAVLLDTFASATAILRALRQRQISAHELLDLHLRQIERYNPTLNAIVTPNYDDARRVAARADKARASGEERPLLGLPVTVKDCIYMKGLPTTGGLPERANMIDEVDAPLVSRLRAAGTVIMGKTNVPTYALDWQSNNPLFGRSLNPWHPNYTPGGSTGGGAAAVAAGLTPLEFGSDSGGSIRQPAAFCGIYGHKPSESAVASYGHLLFPDAPNPTVAMFVQGPLARFAEDLELALEVISGPGIGEDVGWQLKIPSARHNRLSDYRVAILPAISWLPVDDEIMAALDRLVTNLSRVGVRVQETQPEPLGDMRDYYALYLSIYHAMSQGGQSAAERRAQADEIRRDSPDFDGLACANGLLADVSDYIIWFVQREQYRAAFRAFFQEWDVLLSPASMVNAFPHNDEPVDNRQFEINGRIVPYGHQSVYPSLCNLSGHPRTAFPVGLTRSGLPIGLQTIGPYLEDRTSIRFADLIAREFGGFCPPPRCRDIGS